MGRAEPWAGSACGHEVGTSAARWSCKAARTASCQPTAVTVAASTGCWRTRCTARRDIPRSSAVSSEPSPQVTAACTAAARARTALKLEPPTCASPNAPAAASASCVRARRGGAAAHVEDPALCANELPELGARQARQLGANPHCTGSSFDIERSPPEQIRQAAAVVELVVPRLMSPLLAQHVADRAREVRRVRDLDEPGGLERHGDQEHASQRALGQARQGARLRATAQRHHLDVRIDDAEDEQPSSCAHPGDAPRRQPPRGTARRDDAAVREPQGDVRAQPLARWTPIPAVVRDRHAAPSTIGAASCVQKTSLPATSTSDPAHEPWLSGRRQRLAT
jgi:hypothetical protein